MAWIITARGTFSKTLHAYECVSNEDLLNTYERIQRTAIYDSVRVFAGTEFKGDTLDKLLTALKEHSSSNAYGLGEATTAKTATDKSDSCRS